jgi:NAD(P)-dependent dehydrogenase (short-subunit alcohol dehydrogenase family)
MPPAPASPFGAHSTTDEVLGDRDLSGTIALVTGASAGLGVETVRSLAAHGATVIAAVRDPAKGRAALAVAGTGGGADDVTFEEVDLGSLESVRSFTDRIAAEHDQLDLLIANAGVMACPEGRTADGFEIQFGTNHLGHFLLVNRLVPLLVAGAPSRVVCLSSAGHRLSDVDLADPNFDEQPYHPWVAYGRSKTANVLFAVELDRRLRDRGVRACAVHPGGIDTDLDRHLDADSRAFVAARRQQSGSLQKSVAAGAATTVWAAVVADPEVIGGVYAEDCGVAPVLGEDSPPDSSTGVRAYAVDPENAARLWARSEDLVGENFGPA